MQRKAEGAASPGVPFVEAHLSRDWPLVELYVFSDMHVGDPRFDRRLFEQVRDWILQQPHRYCILNGDIMNAALPDSPGGPYDDALNPEEQLEWCQREFAPLKERILLVTEGNHEARIRRRTSIHVLRRLAEHLGVAERYFPEGAFLKVTFGTMHNGKRAAWLIYATHGASGAQLEGGKALAMARMAEVAFADVYIQSHTHWRAAFKQAVWLPDPRNNCVRLVERLFVNSSTLLSWGGYAQVKGYKPPALGSPCIRLYAEPKRAEAVV